MASKMPYSAPSPCPGLFFLSLILLYTTIIKELLTFCKKLTLICVPIKTCQIHFAESMPIGGHQIR
jgi:hypothetical protein